jgi:hypothetical protein
MPFDGGLSVNQDILVIDKMLEIFGPNGEHWIQGFQYDRRRKWCLVGALKSARRRLRSRDDNAGAFIVYAVWHVDNTAIKRRMSLEGWNDQPGRTFSQIREALTQAKEMALRRPDLFDAEFPIYLDPISRS